jgi:hypothetical protein
MSQPWLRYSLAGITLALMTLDSHAQSPQPHDAWLMQNYRFTGPPPPSKLVPADPVLTELKGIQDTLWTIIRRAKAEEDYPSVLAATAQATANAQLIGAITEHQQAFQTTQSATEQAQLPPQLPRPFFLVALKDRTINTATSYWVDGNMLNYVTLQGIHIIVRLDLVDRTLSRDLNRQRNVEFRLPE